MFSKILAKIFNSNLGSWFKIHFSYRYGDRAPKSYIARVFAVIWIFLGVTIFSMYSAALTSALTKKVVVTSDSLSGKKVYFIVMFCVLP